MPWWAIGLAVGIVAPWVLMTGSLRVAFAEGIGKGLSVWSGMCLATVPIFVGLLWLLNLVTG